MQVIKTNETFDSLDKSKLKRMLDIKEAHREGHLTLEKAKERMKKEVGSIFLAFSAASFRRCIAIGSWRRSTPS